MISRLYSVVSQPLNNLIFISFIGELLTFVFNLKNQFLSRHGNIFIKVQEWFCSKTTTLHFHFLGRPILMPYWESIVADREWINRTLSYSINRTFEIIINNRCWWPSGYFSNKHHLYFSQNCDDLGSNPVSGKFSQK